MNSFLFFYPEASRQGPSEHKFAEINGATVEYTEINGICKVVRVISSNPRQYLNSELMPGADITKAINSVQK